MISHSNEKVVPSRCETAQTEDVLKRVAGETAAELDALLPSILDKAFKGEFLSHI
jgi:hypothetical protein